jgi:hypothetical protein
MERRRRVHHSVGAGRRLLFLISIPVFVSLFTISWHRSKQLRAPSRKDFVASGTTVDTTTAHFPGRIRFYVKC